MTHRPRVGRIDRIQDYEKATSERTVAPFALGKTKVYTRAMSMMTKDEVISQLSRYTGRFPREAVEAAQAMWPEVADDMLGALEFAAGNPQAIADDEGSMLHIFAMHLCSEKRETRALDPILRMMSYSDERIMDALFGDTITEAAGQFVASLYAGDTEPIKQLIENRDAYMYSRGQGIRALSILVAHGSLEREEVIEYLRALFQGRLEREPSPVWNNLAETVAALAASELRAEVEKAYEDGVVEYIFATPDLILADIDRDIDTAMDMLRANPRYGLIEDTVVEMESWAAFANERAPARRNGPGIAAGARRPALNPEATEQLGGTVRREQPKVGRNDPCPCGSGRKFKKCCGR